MVAWVEPQYSRFYLSSFQNSASPFFTGEGLTDGLGVPGLLVIDDKASSISSSSSETFDFVAVGFTGGASLFCGATGGFDVPGFVETTGFFAAAVQPQAGQIPLKFKASPHSLQSGMGWLASSSFGPLSADFGPRAA